MISSENAIQEATIVRQPPKTLPISKPANILITPESKDIINLTAAEALRTKVRIGSSVGPLFADFAETRNAIYQPHPTEVVEEYFDGTIEEVSPDGLRLNTVSSEGEEAEAWLPWTAFEEDPGERAFAEVGAPIRITVFSHRTLVRILRPTQWRVPPEASSAVAEMLLHRMQQILEQG